MKKLLVYLSLFTFSMILFVGCSEKSENSMVGIYLRSTNGSNIIIARIMDQLICQIKQVVKMFLMI